MSRGISLSWLAVAACATTQPANAVPPAQAAEATPAAESPGRALTRAECESLAEWVLDACHDRASVGPSAQAEGWCSDIARRTTTEDRSWVVDCTARVKFIDSACFRSTHRVHKLMDCDTQVGR